MFYRVVPERQRRASQASLALRLGNSHWRIVMSIDPEEVIENEIEEILKPIDDLLAREEDDLKKACETIGRAEDKAKKVIIPARRMDED
jgi:hypothetical protein